MSDGPGQTEVEAGGSMWYVALWTPAGGPGGRRPVVGRRCGLESLGADAMSQALPVRYFVQHEGQDVDEALDVSIRRIQEFLDVRGTGFRLLGRAELLGSDLHNVLTLALLQRESERSR